MVESRGEERRGDGRKIDLHGAHRMNELSE